MDKKPTEWSGIRIPKGINELIEEYLKTEDARKRGLTSKSDVATYALRRLLETEGMYPKRERFEHFNTFEDNVKVVDNVLDRIATIYFKRNRAYCDVCQTEECVHVDYALSIPKVVKILAEHDFPTVRQNAKKWLKEH